MVGCIVVDGLGMVIQNAADIVANGLGMGLQNGLEYRLCQSWGCSLKMQDGGLQGLQCSSCLLFLCVVVLVCNWTVKVLPGVVVDGCNCHLLVSFRWSCEGAILMHIGSLKGIYWCISGFVKGDGMSLLMGHMCCHVQQYVVPCASMR